MKYIQIISTLILIFIIKGQIPPQCSYFEALYLKQQCGSLTHNATNGCEFVNGKCEVKTSCAAYTGNNNELCESIILSDYSKKCEMQSGQCTEVTKTCDKYEAGKVSCSSLSAGGNNKRCVLYNGICSAHYNNCADFTEDVNELKCKLNIPSNSLTKCNWKNDECVEEPRDCSEFGSVMCPSTQMSLQLKVSDDTKKACLPSFNGFGCKEQYFNCELYNALETNKNKFDCETMFVLNIADPSNPALAPFSKCVFKDGTCSTSKKECNELSSDSTLCNAYIPSDSKKCIFIKEKCEEQFKTCEIYDKETTKTKEICENIIPFYTDNNRVDFYSKCVFNGNKCERKKKTCSEIEVKEICISHALDDNNKKCVYDNGECKEEYKSCSSYNNIQNKNEKDCKGIKIYDSEGNIDYNYKCIYQSDSCSQKKLEKCEDYESGQDEEYCTSINLSGDKRCMIKDNNCVEQYIYCTGYEGKDKETCELIIPYQDKTTPLQLTHKCVLNSNNKCVMVEKECKDAQTYEECKLIIPPTNKKCIYLNGECKEQYKNCESYSNNGKEAITESVCNSIVLDYITTDGGAKYQLNKCKFISGTPNKCETQQKKCSDFKVEDYIDICYDISLLSPGKKCVYTNSECTEINRSCLELNSIPVTEEICVAAPTSDSNTKVCSLKSDGSGCEEIEKENQENNENKGTFCINSKSSLFSLLMFIFVLFL